MTYSNFDQRISGKFYLPEERIKYLKKLEQELRESRASFKAQKARRAREAAKSRIGDGRGHSEPG